MHQPMFSVVIPTLNEEKFLPKLLASLVGQTVRSFEVIVVDGSSKDATIEKAQSFREKLPDLKVVVSTFASLPLQRNLGAKAAKGAWLVFVDADSVLLPYFFERIQQFIIRQKPSLFTTWFQPDREASGDAVVTLLGNMIVEGSILFRRPLAPGPLSIVSRSVYGAVGGYDETRAFNEDIDFSLRAAKQGYQLQILRETLCVLSLRRLRNEGTLKVVQQYIRAAMPVLFFKRPMKYMSGYIMGGQLYTKKKKPIRQSVLQSYEKKLKRLMINLFE